MKSTAIDAEMRMIEIFKEKQNLEIKNLIEIEMRNNLIRLENEEMLKKEKEKNELNLKNLFKKQLKRERKIIKMKRLKN
jgi:hypothetical protein